MTKEYPQASGFCQRHQWQLFARLRDTTAISSVSRATREFGAWRSDRCQDNRLWRVNTRVRGIIRALSGDVESLSRAEIDSTLEAGLTTGRSGSNILTAGTVGEAYNAQLPLRIGVLQADGLSYEFFADANQPIEVWGSGVQASILGPETARVILDDPQTIEGEDETVAIYGDYLATAVVQRVDTNLRNGYAIFSEWMPAPTDGEGGAQVARLRVPPRAESVQVFTAAQTVTQVTLEVGADGGTAANDSFTVATLPITAGRSEETFVGRANFLETDVVNEERLFQVVWKVRT